VHAHALSRRHFLALSASAAAACSVPEEPGSDAAFQRDEPTQIWAAPGRVDLAAFACGLQTGDVTSDSALVSLQTGETQVRMELARAIEQRWEPIDSGQTLAVEDGSVQLELSDLEPDSVYAVTFYAADGVRRSRVARFRTALAEGASRVLRFGATSCFGPKNGAFPCVRHAARHNLDFFMLLGDTIYADKTPNLFQYRNKFNHALSLDGINALTASTSIVATWDDHEVDNNWTWDDEGAEARYQDAIGAFRAALPQRTGPTGGIWRKRSWGDAVDVFVLDVRSERLDGRYISPEQMQWLKDSLETSTAAFKLIMNPVPIIDFSHTALGPFQKSERWEGYPGQRKEILEHIRDSDIPGVLWISGDIHFGMVGNVDRPGGAGDNLWEVVTGQAGSRKNPIGGMMRKTERKPVVVQQHNWVLFEADPGRGSIQVQYIGNEGELLASRMLRLW
jgi:phosphodiesterase/alkaline phosphatase D-like protein